METTVSNYQALWEKVLEIVRQTSDSQLFAAFFASVRPLSFKDGVFSVGTNNALTADYVRKNYAEKLEEILEQETGHKTRLEIVVSSSLPEESDFPEEESRETAPEEISVNAEARPNLNPNFVFSNFIIGPSNQYAHISAYSVAQNPGSSFNPLFIYGGSGLGKTHLLHAIGNAIYERDNSKRILYITCENFCNDYQATCSMRTNIHAFREKYRANYDVILIDDVQCLSNVNRTQEEFFNLFEYLFSKGCQIVMTCDKLPRDLKNISDRLITRFQWGLVADIQPPDYETRLAIIQKKCADRGFKLDDEVSRFLAGRVQNHVREIEGVLTRLIVFSSVNSQPITLKFVKECLKEYTSDQNISMEAIKKAVASYFEISVSDLTSSKRPKNIAKPRQLAMFLCRSMTNSSLNEIASSFGGKDHTTVLYACRKIEEGKNNDDELNSQIETLKKYIMKVRREEAEI